MPDSLDAALTEVRNLLLDPDRLVRAVAAGRRRGTQPRWQRVELRPVALKSGGQLQVVSDDGVRPFTRNVAWGDAAAESVDRLLAEPFGNWYVESADGVLQLRVTKRGEAQVHRAAPVAGGPATTGAPTTGASTTGAPTAAAHDRAAAHLLDPGDPLFDVIGGNAAKRRQVDAFLRALAATLGEEELPQPLRVVDLGCGNAYLTFAAYRYLSARGVDVRLTGVDVRSDQRVRNAGIAARLGWSDHVDFVAGTNLEAPVAGADVVLALHACDTATDEALARAVGWGARWVLAAPCCHHDIAAQLRAGSAPDGYRPLTRHPILRERFADVLTDALRAALLRLHGYRVEVVEFVGSVHTPRNLLLRARHTGAPATPRLRAEYDALVGQWGITPALARLLGPVPDAPGPVPEVLGSE
ncbi:class I SAM-dependent methyltransferase [Planosporangium sp. 12N6]|uniref:class I SAM-dependent methyltransferase n=1 Tax=Planosporangium spinosum TaxID=3402278 RepID=UPI003CF57A7B